MLVGILFPDGTHIIVDIQVRTLPGVFLFIEIFSINSSCCTKVLPLQYSMSGSPNNDMDEINESYNDINVCPEYDMDEINDDDNYIEPVDSMSLFILLLDNSGLLDRHIGPDYDMVEINEDDKEFVEP